MKWSILILTIPERSANLARLLSILVPQVDPVRGIVEIVIHKTERYTYNQPELCRGAKRNYVVEKCEGEYFSFIDDDDIVSGTYVDDILNALAQNPDVVTFNGWMTTNGGSRVDFEIKLGEGYECRDGKYYRFPNHLCVFKKSLVQVIKFPSINDGEDYEWAKQIHDRKILKSSAHIEKELYHYDFITKNAKP